MSAGLGAPPPGRSGWFADDVRAGELVRHPGGRTIGADEHVWLAWVTGNASDVHGNADRASRGAFGRPVVLGALTVAIVLGLAAPAEPPRSEAGRTLVGWRNIRLGRPVSPGDTLTASSLILSVTPLEGSHGASVSRVITAHDQLGNEVARVEEERWIRFR